MALLTGTMRIGGKGQEGERSTSVRFWYLGLISFVWGASRRTGPTTATHRRPPLSLHGGPTVAGPRQVAQSLRSTPYGHRPRVQTLRSELVPHQYLLPFPPSSLHTASLPPPLSARFRRASLLVLTKQGIFCISLGNSDTTEEFYKKAVVTCCDHYIAVDVFAAGHQYIDVASLGQRSPPLRVPRGEG